MEIGSNNEGYPHETFTFDAQKMQEETESVINPEQNEKKEKAEKNLEKLESNIINLLKMVGQQRGMLKILDKKGIPLTEKDKEKIDNFEKISGDVYALVNDLGHLGSSNFSEFSKEDLIGLSQDTEKRLKEFDIEKANDDWEKKYQRMNS